MEAVHNVPEGGVEVLAAAVFEPGPHLGGLKRTVGCKMQVVRRKQRIAIKISATGNGHIAEGVVVGGIATPGAPAPFFPVAEFSLVEGRHVVGQEVRTAPAAELREAGLCRNGIALGHPVAWIHSGKKAGCGLAEQPGKGLQDAVGAKLQLRNVAVFMNGQFPDPRQGFRGIGFRHGIQVHAHRRPGNRAVGIWRIGVQDNGGLAPVGLAGKISCGKGHAGAVCLKGAGINHGQGIQALGINYLIVGRMYVLPFYAAWVIAGKVKLGTRPEKGRECQYCSQ